MLKGWGTWFGLDSPVDCTPLENESAQVEDEKTVAVRENEVNKQDSDMQQETDPALQLFQHAKGLSGYVFSFASSATKKLSDSMAETAQTIKQSVKEGNLDGIIDKTIWGDFQKEQEKFVQEKNAKKTDAAVPPWVGSSDEETLQQQILALSADRRNFLRDPPAGVQFHFDFEQMYPIAMVMLIEDELLKRMRFDLVPKQVKEDAFWRNYFYRVSLVKQSSQLFALAALQQDAENKEKEKDVASHDGMLLTDIRPKTPPIAMKMLPESHEEEEEVSTSPGVVEFVSDAFDTCDINQDDLRKEMEQLVLDKKEEAPTVQEETADWEKELQDYEVVTASDNSDQNWDKEIENMLQSDG